MPTLEEQEIHYDHIDSDDNGIYYDRNPVYEDSDDNSLNYSQYFQIEDEEIRRNQFLTRTQTIFSGRNRTRSLSMSQ
ncbi:hypothetical protein ma848 [Moumouvirus australiensis]|uniref:Uncharacterized protein n=1 Tax=Moumouvirus australiensis TaxID=2109587 RepID=A0A2P1EMV7_9VIRU|nr:hypothetical protein QKC55_gp056 [Moumouvirus australiensis]AVL95235.1 hypothetical protein ma848 [Moumouvirus australiensis]